MKFGAGIVLMWMLLAATGCASKAPGKADIRPDQIASAPFENRGEIKGAPAWVSNGNFVQDKKDARIFVGVGAAATMGDLAMQKAVADDKARAEIAQVLNNFTDSVQMEYQARTKVAEPVKMSAIDEQLKKISKAALATARIAGSWRDPQTNIIWSMAELDVGQISRIAAASSEMNVELQQMVKELSVTFFERLLKEKK